MTGVALKLTNLPCFKVRLVIERGRKTRGYGTNHKNRGMFLPFTASWNSPSTPLPSQNRLEQSLPVGLPAEEEEEDRVRIALKKRARSEYRGPERRQVLAVVFHSVSHPF